ncbi:MAG TPA: nodulation protein NfeD [Anaerolineales bacterium]|jgi:membrane-bound serine protease (ClpP class)
MKFARLMLILLGLSALALRPAQSQSDEPLAVVLTVDGGIMPAMKEYIQRGLDSAEQRGAEVVIIQLNTPGGDLGSTVEIIQAFRNSSVPVVVYVTPNGSMAGSAGAIITLAAHAAAMSPETAIGAASPVGAGGAELDKTLKAKATEIIKAQLRPLVERRGAEAQALAMQMIDTARAVSAREALEVGLIDFVATDVSDLLRQLDGFQVEMSDGPRTLHTSNARTEPVNLTLIEQLLLMLTDPNISFLLIAIGVQAILIEISSPGGWVAGFIGVVCLTLATYGLGVLPVNWFGLVFMLMSFVLFVLDIKAPTHGALTAAGVGSFIVGALVLFNSPGTPQFQRVSIPLVIGVGIFLGLAFAVILTFALRAQRTPIQVGMEALAGKRGIATTTIKDEGHVQVGGELWSARPAEGSEAIHKGDPVEVVRLEGLRLIVKKK